MPKRTESTLVRAILDYLELRNIMAFRVNTTGVFDPTRKVFRKFSGRRGVSDIIGVFNGRFLAIECKTDEGRVSQDQQEFLDDVQSHRGIAIVARSVDDVERVLTEQSWP